MTRGLKLRWVDSRYMGKVLGYSALCLFSGAQQLVTLGRVHQVQERPNTYECRGAGDRYAGFRTTNLRRARAWLRLQVQRELAAVAGGARAGRAA